MLAFLALMVSPASALMLNQDLGGITVGVQASGGGLFTNEIVGGGSPPEDHGSLTTQVFQNGGIYTYEATVTPKVTGISVFSTSFTGGIAGLTGRAGWSFANATSAGASDAGSAFFMTLSPNGNLTWHVDPVQSDMGLWATAGVAITFFFQSMDGPQNGGVYSMTNAFTGSAIGYASAPAPVPEPGSLLLLAAGMLGVGLLTTRRRSHEGWE